mgnify:CR=1 FL=1
MFVVSVALGVVTGWLAGMVLKDGGYGRVPDVVLGLMGSGGLTTFAVALGAPAEMGRIALAGIAFLGAFLMVLSQRKFWPAASRPFPGSRG